MKIKEVKITKSALFGELLLLNLSEKMTCVMGGRGAGKTTLLTLIKWCLNDDKIFSRNELNLVKTNLGTGTIEVVITAENNEDFTFIKNWGEEPHLKNSKNQLVKIDDIFSSKIIDFYSSGSIEQIGTDPFQRMKIIDEAIGSEIENINRDILVKGAEIEKNRSELSNMREEYRKINQEISGISNAENLLKEAQDNLDKQTSNEKEKEVFDLGIEKQKKRYQEVIELQRLEEFIKSAISDADEYLNKIEISKFNFNLISVLPNDQIVTVSKLFSNIIDKSHAFIIQEKLKVSEGIEEYKKMSAEINSRHQLEELEFAEVRKKLESNRELYQKVSILNDTVTKFSSLRGKLEEAKGKGISLTAQRSELLSTYQSLYAKKTNLRILWSENLNKIIGSDIKIAVSPYGDKTNYEKFIREIVTLAKMKVTNEHLLWELSSPSMLLDAINRDKVGELAEQLNLSTDRLEAISKAIAQYEKKQDLELVICDDQVNFFLKTGVEDNPSSYKATELLSLGQRCTTILPILFCISKIPLLIDQPEDNLDNRFITDTIHRIIKATKEKRQLTFVTHNPNIPVGSDSEHNIFISFENGLSILLKSGTIDEVKGEIVDLLEGGEAAFIRRKQCYDL